MQMVYDKLKKIGLIILGNLLIACAVSFFILPNNILTGGVAGVSVALQPLLGIDPVLFINMLTIGLYLLGALLLGKEFALKTCISAFVSPLFITLLSYLVTEFPEGYFQMNELLASIYSGVLMGIGLGIVFQTNASTGGMDIPALILNKYCKIDSGTAVMVIDGCTVLLGILTYNLSMALTGIVSVFVCGKTINYVIKIKTQAALEVEIISEQYLQIQDYILNSIDRGVTLMEGCGAFTKSMRPIIMCVISQTQFPMLEKQVQFIDPNAFMIVKDIHKVKGKGF